MNISCTKDHLLVAIHDNGVGFTQDHSSSGMGLKNMTTRAEMLGGRLTVFSEPQQGTQIQLELPVEVLSLE